ncbi:MAG: DUF2235 domain-containing protein [Gammaproteobacteria bacterium]
MALYAFDGTWNDSSVSESERDLTNDTNVHRFRNLYQDDVSYVDGVGTRFGTIGRVIGGLTGAGAQRRIEEQFQALESRFANGDTTVDVVGYSRGAAIARMFVHQLGARFQNLKINGAKLQAPPTVRFLGLFDTVASFGVPWSDNEGEFKKAIPDFVERTYHAMAIGETREAFGIERCVGDRRRITEVWFRGGHGDVGGNATIRERGLVKSNRARSDVPLNWLVSKALGCGLPLRKQTDAATKDAKAELAPIVTKTEPISIGKAGTLSRRIHAGDLVHYSVEDTMLTCSIDGRELRRIDVITRIEDLQMEEMAEAHDWIPPASTLLEADNLAMDSSVLTTERLSMRRYPFDTPPARTWRAWREIWGLSDTEFDIEDSGDFWSPNDADKALAWDLLVELQSRIAVQALQDDEGTDKAALESLVSLFGFARESMKRHGVNCSNTSALLLAFLNHRIRPVTSKWHLESVKNNWADNQSKSNSEFRDELRSLQSDLALLVNALGQIAGTTLGATTGRRCKK